MSIKHLGYEVTIKERFYQDDGNGVYDELEPREIYSQKVRFLDVPSIINIVNEDLS